jgi:hypothetical protein
MGIALLMLGVGAVLFVGLYFLLSFSMTDWPEPKLESSELIPSMRGTLATDGYPTLAHDDHTISRLED